MPHPIPPPILDILKDPYDVILARSILGTADAGAIHRALAGFCDAHLGSGLADVPYWTASVGAGFGLVPKDGRQLFLKA